LDFPATDFNLLPASLAAAAESPDFDILEFPACGGELSRSSITVDTINSGTPIALVIFEVSPECD
jgi:hypothetical protein